MSFNNEFIAATLTEAVDIAATRISQNFALNAIADKGSCTLEEAQNMYELAHRVLTEGSEDLIPENLDIPTDATDAMDPTAPQDATVDADVANADMGDEDLDLADLEGIILPDSEGNQYIIQGGILVPYEEEGSDATMVSGDDQIPAEGGDVAPAAGGDVAPADDGDGDTDSGIPFKDKEDEEDEDLKESTGVDATNIQSIEESDAGSVFKNNSSIVANLIKNVNFAK